MKPRTPTKKTNAAPTKKSKPTPKKRVKPAPKKLKESVELPEELMNALEEIEMEYAEAATRRESIREEIKNFIMESGFKMARCAYCTVKLYTGRKYVKFDSARLKQDAPEIYEQYSTVKVSEPFITIYSASIK